MLTIIMKWASITMLLLAGLWRSSANYQLLVEFVVCVGAILVALDAVRAEKYLWATGFVAMALVFNPIGPVRFSDTLTLWVDVACVAAFLISLAVVKRKAALLDELNHGSEARKPVNVAGDSLRVAPVH